jgi:hypothetical protein
MGRNIEAYIDDIMIRTKHRRSLISDLWETFNNLQKVQLKVNPGKCAFWEAAGFPGITLEN